MIRRDDSLPAPGSIDRAQDSTPDASRLGRAPTSEGASSVVRFGNGTAYREDAELVRGGQGRSDAEVSWAATLVGFAAAGVGIIALIAAILALVAS